MLNPLGYRRVRIGARICILVVSLTCMAVALRYRNSLGVLEWTFAINAECLALLFAVNALTPENCNA